VAEKLKLRPSIGGSGKAIRTVRGSDAWLRNS
jgi:hypothetical protein